MLVSDAPSCRRPTPCTAIRTFLYMSAGIRTVFSRSDDRSRDIFDPVEREHALEVLGDFCLEIGLDFVDLPELGESPASVGAQMVHARDPVGLHCGLLRLRVFA